MSETKNYKFYVTDDSSERFLDWRKRMNGETDSNMVKIDAILGQKADSSDIINATIGVCDTAAGATAKVVALDGFKLKEGVRIAVKFANANTASKPYLNVNNTGAMPIKKYSATPPETNMWVADSVVSFVYDGTNWIVENGGAQEALRRKIDNVTQELNANPGMYRDVTQDYVTARKQNPGLLARDYLAALPDGRFQIREEGDTSAYFSRNVDVLGCLHAEVTEFCDDSYAYRYKYSNGILNETWEVEVGSAASVSARQIAENTSRIAALEARIAALESKA